MPPKKISIPSRLSTATSMGRPTKKVEKKQKKELTLALPFVSMTERALFAKHLSVTVQAGLTVIDSLAILEEQAKGYFKKVLQSVHASVEKGLTLAESLAMHPRAFPPIFINLVKAGEASGTLEENLRHLADQLEKDTGLRRKVKGAMMYPAFVFSMATIAGFALAFLVLPRVTELFKGSDIPLPMATKILLFIADWFSQYSIQTVIGFIAIVVGFIWLTRLKFVKPITHRIILRSPIFGKIAAQVNLTSFCRTMGICLRSGLTIDTSIIVTSDVLSNFYYKSSCKKIAEMVKEGKTMSEGMERSKHLFPPITYRMVNVGENTGRLENVLMYLADYYEAEVDSKIKNISNVIEPILLVIIGLVVGFVALAIVSPIYQYSGSVTGMR